VVPHHTRVGAVVRDNREVRALPGLDDEQQPAVELRHRVAYAAAAVAELDRGALRQGLHPGGDGRELVRLVDAQLLGPAQLQSVAGEHEGVPGPGSALEKTFQEPGQCGVSGLHGWVKSW
jgi:hypothetical protein